MSKKLKLFVFSIAFTALLFIFIVIPLTITAIEPQIQPVEQLATNYAYMPFAEKLATSFATGFAEQTEGSIVTYGFLSLGGVLGSIAVLLPFSDQNQSDKE